MPFVSLWNVFLNKKRGNPLGNKYVLIIKNYPDLIS